MIQAPGFGLGQPWLLWAFRQWISGCKISLNTFQIKKFIFRNENDWSKRELLDVCLRVVNLWMIVYSRGFALGWRFCYKASFLTIDRQVLMRAYLMMNPLMCQAVQNAFLDILNSKCFNWSEGNSPSAVLSLKAWTLPGELTYCVVDQTVISLGNLQN